MASTVVVTIKTEKTQAQSQTLLKLGTNKDQVSGRALEQFIKDIRTGNHRGVIDVQTSDTTPVAASSTYTLATVIATNTATVGKTVMTFTASPTTSLHVLVTVASAKAFASSTDLDITTGTITETTHGFLTGDVGQMTTSSALPTGLALSTDYHVIKLTADTYALASSQANAVAGIAIKPTAVGTGNQTLTLNANKTLAFRLAEALNAHADVPLIATAVAAADVVTVTAKQKGLVGNHIAASSAGGTITVTGSGYLAGGTGGACDAANTATFGI